LLDIVEGARKAEPVFQANSCEWPGGMVAALGLRAESVFAVIESGALRWAQRAAIVADCY